jgi:ABC-type multidrug transport system fused ATPase/permease subunit
MDNKNIIEFKDVSFSYNDQQKIIENINLKLIQGNINTIIGKNGSGKTTLMNLVLNIWDNYTGDIYVNEIDIKEFDREDLLGIIGCCFQKTPIFKDTIEKNIILDYQKDEKKLNFLLKQINLFDDFTVLNDGIQTIISDNNKLSGGQVQKIGILRAIFANKPILIFDEPTSSLDNISHTLFIKLVNEMKKKHLIVVISHDEKIINVSDYIVEV